MRKNRVYTILERKRNKRTLLVTIILITVLVVGGIAGIIAFNANLGTYVSGIKNKFSSIGQSVDNNAELDKAVDVETDNLPEEATETEVNGTNLTLDVLSQELVEEEPVDLAVGAKIWACKELPCFSDETLGTQIGTILPNNMYQVVEVVQIAEKPFFRIETTFGNGYVNAGYCFIDLKDYLGDDTNFSLVNAVDSPIKVCGFPINNITGEKIPGLSNTEDLNGENKILLLYPTAIKLKEAMDLARQKGYYLRVYETVRPDSTVQMLHDIMSEQFDNRIAQKTYNGIDIKDYFDEYKTELENAGIKVSLTNTTNSELQSKWARSWYNSALENQGSAAAESIQSKLSSGNYEIIVKNLPNGGYVDGKGYIHTADGTEVLDAKGYWTWADFDVIELPIYKDYEGNTVRANSYGIVFRDLMEGDKSACLENYFERTGSDYSRGLTVDVSLINTETDNELIMQSDIYDMSLMSNPTLNNDESKALADIMQEAGFETDGYVWWHFTDVENKKKYAGIPVIE